MVAAQRSALTPTNAELMAIRRSERFAFDDLWKAWRPIAVGIARQFARRRPELDSYIADGMVALWEACLSFPIGEGARFRFYAARAIRNRMVDRLRRRTRRGERAVRFVDPTLVPESPCFDDDGLGAAERAGLAENWLESLGTRDRMIIHGCFGEGLAQSQVAARLHLSPARVSQRLSALLASAKMFFAVLEN